MRRINRRWLVVLLAVTLCSVGLAQSSSNQAPVSSNQNQPSNPGSQSASDAAKMPDLSKLALAFVPNVGQFDAQVRYVAHGPGYTLFLTDKEAVMVISQRQSSPGRDKSPRYQSPQPSQTSNLKPQTSVLRYQWQAANAAPQFVAANKLAGSSNYFIGNDKTKWHTDVPSYSRVTYQALYPGIDLSYYSTGGQLEYDLTVAPGADPSRIRLAVTGAKVEAVAGELLLHTTVGDIRQPAPRIYQDGPNGKQEISGGYQVLADGSIGFSLAAYDTSRPLVIDPVVDYATYLGGDGWWDEGMAIKADAQGNAYVAGYTDSDNFPVYNPIQPAQPGGYAFISKLAADGASFIYSTYFGGGGEINCGMDVDSAGNVYVMGDTQSGNFPLVNPIQSSLRGAQNLFMSKLNVAGNQLLYSTYFGGDHYDYSGGVALDSNGNTFYTGETNSDNFPTQNAIKSYLSGNSDSFVVKFTSNGALIFSTYLGGGGGDGVNVYSESAVATDSAGNVYVTGSTNSADFPTTANAYQRSLSGPSDAFITKLSSDGQHILYSTYLGGSEGEDGAGITVGSDGSAYVTGGTGSLNFPVVNGVQSLYAGGSLDAFVTKLSPDGSSLAYSTYLGGTDYDIGQSIAVDSQGNATVTGRTYSLDYPTYNPVPMRSQDTYGPFVTRLNSSGNGFIYSTYLGGFPGGTDQGMGVALDQSGNTYLTGITFSAYFATTPVVQSVKGAGHDAFVAKLNPASATPSATMTGTPPTATPTDTPIPTPQPSGNCASGLQRVELVNDNAEALPDHTLINYAGDSWVVITQTSHSPTHSWSANAFGSPSYGLNNLATHDIPPLPANSSSVLSTYGLNYLVTHDILPLPINSGSVTLSFWHHYNFGYGGYSQQGGVIEVSTDNGTTWSDLGADIVQNSYNGTVHGGPLDGRPAFVNSNPGYPNYIQTIVRLTTHAGRNVRIRFATNAGGTPPQGGAWNVDDVEIYACTNGTPVPTNTPGGPTNTPVPTNTPATPTMTPVECANPFLDINNNVFYNAIHILNCRGVVSGTDASHYSPAGTATRGQFARTVVKGFGLPLITPASGQDFTDVPPSYFAYLYIESGYHAGILSGFDAASCIAAGATPPCYLPNLAITRAQTARLVVKAAGYVVITPTGGSTFVDVPPSYYAYAYIETAYTHNIIRGVDSTHFQPDRNIRRDEMAQIVYTAVTLP